jgi:hypothetical protein
MKKSFLKSIFIVTTLVAFLTGCGGSPTPSNPTVQNGLVSTAITDLATDSFQQVWIDISKITATNTADGIVQDLTTSAPGAFDLLSLRDITNQFPVASIPEGTYADIKIHITDNTTIEILSNNDKRISRPFLTPTNNYFEVENTTFTVSATTPTAIVIDLDVDSWEEFLSSTLALDPKKLIVTKTLEVKPTKIEVVGIYHESPDRLVTTVETFTLDIPEEFSSMILIRNTEYEVEGILTGDKILVSEIESHSGDTQEAEEIKLRGKITEIYYDESLTNILSFDLLPTKASKIFANKTVKVLLNHSTETVFSKGTISDLYAGDKVKVKGLLTLDNEIDALKISIKGAPHSSKTEESTYLKFYGSIKCEGTPLTCQLEPILNEEELTLVISDYTEIDTSTRQCLSSGNYIDAEISGIFSDSTTDSTVFSVREIESEQRCYDDKTLVKGVIANYNPTTSCVANTTSTFTDVIQGFTGKFHIIAIAKPDATTTTGYADYSSLMYDDITIKISDDDNILKVKTDDSDNLIPVLDFLGLVEADLGQAGIMPFNNQANVYVDVRKAVKDSTIAAVATITILPKNGFFELISTVAGSPKVLAVSDKDYHYKPIICTLDITNDTSNITIVTTVKTKWYGNTGLLADGVELKAVYHNDGTNNIVDSIKVKTQELELDDSIADLRKKLSGIEDDEDKLDDSIYKHKDDEDEDDYRDNEKDEDDKDDERRDALTELNHAVLLELVMDDKGEDIIKHLISTNFKDENGNLLTWEDEAAQYHMNIFVRELSSKMSYFKIPASPSTQLSELLTAVSAGELAFNYFMENAIALSDLYTIMAIDDELMVYYDPTTFEPIKSTITIDFLANDKLPAKFELEDVEIEDGPGSVKVTGVRDQLRLVYIPPSRINIELTSFTEIEYEIESGDDDSEAIITIYHKLQK